ncbi:MAG: NAD-dependent deacylase [Dehalococcoidia bacterium]
MYDPIERAALDLTGSGYAIALTGAGMSTESGIPDFRGPKGIWTTNREAEAQAYKRYDLFLRDPRSYWEEVSGSQGTHGAFYGQVRKAEPNLGHYALAELEEMGILKCVITQNIDGLHRKAGSKRVIEYHGSVHKLRCPACNSRFGFGEVQPQELPPHCRCGGALKLDVVHFNEPIPFDVMEEAEREASQCDAVLVCGTSASVYPFASLPRVARSGDKARIRIIEVNAEPTPLTAEGISDCLIQGMTGEILPWILQASRRKRSDGS